jgi:hypothetical protein
VACYYISFWYLVPADQAHLIPENAAQVAEKWLLLRPIDKGELSISSRRGYIDYAIKEFGRHVPVDALTKLLDPEAGGMTQFRCVTYHGEELEAIADAVKRILDWARADSVMTARVLGWDSVSDVTEAVQSDVVERELRFNPAIKWSDDGDGPHVLFAYLRGLQALFERAEQQGATVLQLKSSG